MKTTSLFLSAACFLVLAASGFAQDAQTENVQPKKSPGILGYLDPKTGAFRILPAPDKVSPDLPAVAPTVGKFVFNITIALNPGLSSTAKILCTAIASTNRPPRACLKTLEPPLQPVPAPPPNAPSLFPTVGPWRPQAATLLA